MCFTVNCSVNQYFSPCTENEQADECKDCPPGTLMLDKIDTYNWEESPACRSNECDECDISDSVLDNPETCGSTEFARCVCDRTKLYYGTNKPGTVTSCMKKEGDLCDRQGVQLNQRGECEPCPAGTEKQTNDTSLCKNKVESKILTTIPDGTGNQPSISTLNPRGEKGIPDEGDSIGAGGIIGIILGVVLVLAVLMVTYGIYNRRRNSQKREKSGDGSSNNISSDGSSGGSEGNSEQSLLMKSPPSLDLNKNDNKSFVKPMMKVEPMISVDESKDCEDGNAQFSIDNEIIHQGIQYVNEEIREPSIPMEAVGPDNSITDLKTPFSADETDLKVPVTSDINNTAVKALHSEETEVKQLMTGPSDRSCMVGAIPLGQETFLKQVGRDNSRVVCPNDNTMVKPIVTSGDTAIKQCDSSKKISEVKIGSVKPSVSQEETSPKLYDLDTNRTVLVSPNTPGQSTNQRSVDEHYQVHDTNFPEMIGGEEYSSSPIHRQTRIDNPSLQNSIRPSVCHTKALSTERAPPSVDTRHLSQNNISVPANELIGSQNQEFLTASDQMSSSDKILAQKNCGYLEDSNTMPVVSSVRAASLEGSNEDEEGAEGVENLSPQTGSGVVTPRVTPTCRPQRVEPVRAREKTAVQPILQCTSGAVGQVNSKGYDRQISGQNSSGSMYQNSTVENSTASSGYGTARKSEMESSGKNLFLYTVQRNPSEVGSPEPIVINPLLRSESHEANDSHQPAMRNNKSLRLMSAPSLRPDSSDSVQGIVEHQDMPEVIKREEIPLLSRADESSNRVVPNHQIATVESGYCS